MNKSLLNIALDKLTLLHPKVIDLSLKRVYGLLKQLDDPHLKIPPTIHIAGTNGKGSTLSFIKKCMEIDGKLVHSYISPHLIDFNERINLKGIPIDDNLLLKYIHECEEKNKKKEITFFEFTTCLAFMAFSKEYADYLLLEVGLGGRLDATNVIDSPSLSVLTPISKDHESFLGNTLEKITNEKAGIMKTNVKTIVGKQKKSVLRVLKKQSTKINSPLFVYGEDWTISNDKNQIKFETNEKTDYYPIPNLIGKHQIENAGIAIATLKQLKINEKSISSGVLSTFWPARFQLLKKGSLIRKLKKENQLSEIWVDGGHNEEAGKAVAKTIKELPALRTFVIFGMVKTKDVKNYLKYFKNIKLEITGIKIPEQFSYNEIEILTECKKLNLECFLSYNLQDSINKIIEKSQKKSIRVIICGSLYLAGYILKINNM